MASDTSMLSDHDTPDVSLAEAEKQPFFPDSHAPARETNINETWGKVSATATTPRIIAISISLGLALTVLLSVTLASVCQNS